MENATMDAGKNGHTDRGTVRMEQWGIGESHTGIGSGMGASDRPSL